MVSQLPDFGHLVVVILEIRCPKKSSSLMEDNLRGMKTFNGKLPLMEYNPLKAMRELMLLKVVIQTYKIKITC